MGSKEDEKRFSAIADIWIKQAVGLIKEMDIRIEQASADGVVMRMPHNPDFCIDEEGTLLHGGVLTALLDSAFGFANFSAIKDVASMATLDLRIDYLRPAKSRADVMVFADCYRQTRHVAFGSGKIWFDTESKEEIARGNATFAIVRGEGNLLDKTKTRGPSG